MVTDKDSQNTEKARKNAVATITAFYKETGRDLTTLEELPKDELNELLIAFYVNASKKNAMTSLHFGLQQYFMSKREVKIITDLEFAKAKCQIKFRRQQWWI